MIDYSSFLKDDYPLPASRSYGTLKKREVESEFKAHDSPCLLLSLPQDEQRKLVSWCLELGKIKTFNKGISSYGLKHLFGNGRAGFYVSNGAIKGAMIVADFKIKDEQELNWFFNISQKGINQVRHDIDRYQRLQAKAKDSFFYHIQPSYNESERIREFKRFTSPLFDGVPDSEFIFNRDGQVRPNKQAESRAVSKYSANPDMYQKAMDDHLEVIHEAVHHAVAERKQADKLKDGRDEKHETKKEM